MDTLVQVLGLSIPIERNVDGCEFLTTGCPLSAGGEYVYSRAQEVTSFVSNVNITLQFSMASESGDRIVCYNADMHIV